jgi:ADP-heptose:LPS heptosyltransferase
MDSVLVPPKKILIVHSGGIGDLLLALPAMRLFRTHFPHSILELLGRPERLSLVAFDLHAGSVHSIDQARMAHLYQEGNVLPPNLTSFISSFDIALVFGKTRTRPLVSNFRAAGVGRVLFIPSLPPEGMKIHASAHLLECLGSYGIKGKNSFVPLSLPSEAVAWAGNFLENIGLGQKEKILLIHPGSGSPAKNWSPKNFARVADWFSDRGKILIIAGPAADGVREVMGDVKKARPLLVENLPLLHLAAIMKMGTTYLGNDSGISHLAALLGVPTTVLFGPTRPAVWKPIGPLVKIIHAGLECCPCAEKVRSKCFRPCLENITPELVIQSLPSPFA